MGNFSKDPAQVLAEAIGKDYVSALIQQGVPVMDRDANLMCDLAHHWIREVNKKYIGNGVPAGSNGFRISDVDIATNDFTIKAGTIMANGFLINLAADTTYKTQPVKTGVAPLPSGKSNIYLHVRQEEVGANQDPALGNDDDVGIETSRRRKVVWQVMVSETEITTEDHLLLATLKNPPNGQPEILDERVRNLTISANRNELAEHNTRLVEHDTRITTLETRGVGSVKFTEAAANGAKRTVNVGFRPNIVLVAGSAHAEMVGRTLGGGVFAFADISKGTKHCFSPVVLADATAEWWYHSTSAQRLCDCTFTDRNAGIKSETLRVDISEVTANGLILELFRFTLGSALQFSIDLNLLCIG
jgi:hypothetical protein